MNIREVVLNGGYPWGFRIAGGAEFQQPLRVSKANRGSSAASKGVQEGDLIASINDVNATDITNSAAHDLLKGPGSVLKLQLNKGACQLPKDRRPTFANQRSAELKSVLGSTTEFKKHDISPVSTLSSSGSALAESRRAVFEEVGSDRVATPKFDLITFGCAKRQKEMSSVSRRAHATTYKVSEGSDLNGHLQADLEIIEHTTGLSNKHALLDDSLTNYKVESPELLRKKRKASKSAPIVKSKSLDDDDVKITEITSDSEDKCSTEFNAIVTEDDSDVEWETTEELAKNVVKVDAVETSFSPLKDSVIEDVVIIYPQDESDSPPSPKKPRCPKRVLHNPTFLEVINEETSDLSDREQKQKESPGNAPEEVIQSDWNITFVNSALGAEVVYLEDNETEPDAKQTDEVPEESQSIDQLPSEGSEESQETDQLSKDNSSEENETDSDVEVKQTNCDILNEDLENVCTDSSYQKCDVTRSESVSPVTTSSGQSTSQCTERYIPLSASVGDVASILKSEESPEDHHDPLPLKDLCLLRLTSSPYGVDVLQELADVSSSIEATIRNITLKQEVNAKDSHLPAFMSTDYQRPFKSLFKGCNASFNLAATEPKLQMSEVKVNGISQNERFITVERENQDLSGRRLGDGWSTLPTSTKKNRSIKEQNENHFLYYVENVSNKSREKMCSQPDVRLNARSLAEWLHMARSEDSPGFNKMQNLCDSGKCDRRFSLPNELYEFHRLSILQQEKEIELEIKWLEEEKKRLTEMADAEDKKARKTSRTFPMAPAEFFRQKMYDEYMRQLAAREDRKLNKVIKVSSPPISDDTTKGSRREAIRISGIEEEFMSRVKERMSKLGMSQDDANRSESCNEEDDGEPVLVIDGRSLKNSKTLPKHIRELLDVSCYFIDDNDETAVWSPGQSVDSKSREISFDDDDSRKDDPIPPVWTPQSVESSPTAERKEFKPIGFRSPVLARKNKSVVEEKEKVKNFAQPPWANPGTRDLSFRDSSTHKPIAAPRLPKTQLPTITLLQKAREGQLPRGAIYIDQPKRILKHERPAPVDPGEIFYTIKQDRTETSDSEGPKKMVDLGRRKFEGIGPTTKDGMPLILRSEVKENNQSKWYKKMYDTIHKQRGSNDEYVTVKYKQNRGRYPYASGYFSEPEPTSYDSDAALSDNKYATVDRRLYSTPDVYPTSSLPKPATKRFSSSDDTIKHGQDVYKNQPGRIENYIPGRSSISEKEAKEWWSEVMDMFDGQLDQYRHVPKHRGHMSQALKESGYESDSTLVFRRREDAMNQLNPSEQKEAYKHIQKGGDVPLQGLRKPAPERPKDDMEIEYFPISPTLTRIRIHKNIQPQKEILCFPINIPPHPPHVFSSFKRNAPSNISSTDAKTTKLPPPPPKRKSSRNNSTLRLISTMKVRTDQSPSGKRHETCFISTSSIGKNKVKYLKDGITCKLSSLPKKNKKENGSSPRIKVSKTVKALGAKSQVSSTLTTSRNPSTSEQKVVSRTNVYSKKDDSSNGRCHSRSTSASPGSAKGGPKKSDSKGMKSPTGKTFGSEKHKVVDLVCPRFLSERRLKILKSPDLVSPNAVKKVLTQSRAKSKEDLTSSKTKPKPTHTKKGNPKQSYSLPTTPSLTKKSLLTLPKYIEKIRMPNLRKTSSHKIVEESKHSTGQVGSKRPTHDATHKEIKEVRNRRMATTDSPKKAVDQNGEIQRMANVRSDSFFQNLFLRNIPVAWLPKSSKTSWISDKAEALLHKKEVFSTKNALLIYLKHTKPVTDSKFKNYDKISWRPRSSSIFPEVSKSFNEKERSVSLPPKLTFSQTSRAISPSKQYIYSNVVLCNNQNVPSEDFKLPSANLSAITQSITSINTSSIGDHQLVTELVRNPRQSKKVKELNEFYSTLARMNELERTTSFTELRPRRRHEDEIIDYDRWKEVRTIEKAERELELLRHRIKLDQKQRGMYVWKESVQVPRWKSELDRSLRIKEKSVEDLKNTFEKSKDELRKENVSNIYKKELYKPLWRGNSVVNLGARMVEKRSHSEGRTVRRNFLDSEHLLNREIGSRIWSSLSAEQVNILKNQLTEIYTQDIDKRPMYTSDYVYDAKNKKQLLNTSLVVRRNSDVSEKSHRFLTTPSGKGFPDNSLSESEKRKLSHTLSKEVLDRVSKQPYYTTSLSLSLNKEIGSTTDKASSPRTCYSLEFPDAHDSDKDQDNFLLVLTKSDPPQSKELEPFHSVSKISSSETESTDESTKTVIYVGNDGIKKKINYFENKAEVDQYVPTVHRPSEGHYDVGEAGVVNLFKDHKEHSNKMLLSQSYQDFREYFGEHGQSLENLSGNSRTTSPCDSKKEVRKLREKFEYLADFYSNRSTKPRRTKSNPELYRKEQISIPGITCGEIDTLRRRYEYPVVAGRGRSRVRRGGVVSPIFLRAEDRYMPHINIISKIASLYPTKSNIKKASVEEIAKMLGCPVKKLREKFESPERNISFLGHIFTSSPSVNELRDITPYLAGAWTAHRFPKSEDNARSSSSPLHTFSHEGDSKPNSFQNSRKHSRSTKTQVIPQSRTKSTTSSCPRSVLVSRPSVTFKGVV